MDARYRSLAAAAARGEQDAAVEPLPQKAGVFYQILRAARRPGLLGELERRALLRFKHRANVRQVRQKPLTTLGHYFKLEFYAR
jgi:hypothetical protein